MAEAEPADTPASSPASHARPPLLFLCHRIPYPPNKGDKIRAYHLLRYLGRYFRLYLATFVDDANDWQHTDALNALCEQAHFEPLNPRLATLRSALGLLRGEALSLPYYRGSGLDAVVRNWVACEGIRHVLVYSSVMAQFVPAPGRHAAPASYEREVVDFVDVDSEKWRQYADTRRWPLNWVYRREGRCLLAWERSLISRADAGFFVSAPEAALFRKLAPSSAHKVSHYHNGVDTTYFCPDRNLPNPYSKGEQTLVFTGAMDYWPNVDAVCWFADSVLPCLRARNPEVTLCIVGSSPTPAVQRLAARAGIRVTGRVPDVRPYQQHALAVVAPLRVARGVQNKVLEGMSMARPVLVSPMGLEGINAVDEQEVLLCREVSDYTRQVEALLLDGERGIGERARARIEADFLWESSLPAVATELLGDLEMLSDGSSAPACDGPSGQDTPGVMLSAHPAPASDSA